MLAPALNITPWDTVIVEASYYSWYRHRCVLHGSDIDECSAKSGAWLGWLSDERG